jgi:hypothetical protein
MESSPGLTTQGQVTIYGQPFQLERFHDENGDFHAANFDADCELIRPGGTAGVQQI